jgi:glutaredoxin
MLVKALREGLGRLIVLIDFITRPRKMRRSEEQQQQVAEAASKLSLYQFYACPFCVKTRRAMHRLNLPISTRDASQGSEHRAELEAQAGKVKVPCLRIEEGDKVTWMYESNDIISYLEQRFGEPQAA